MLDQRLDKVNEISRWCRLFLPLQCYPKSPLNGLAGLDGETLRRKAAHHRPDLSDAGDFKADTLQLSGRRQGSKRRQHMRLLPPTRIIDLLIPT